MNSHIANGPSPPAGRYIAECGHVLGAALPRLLDALFDKVDDALNDQADRSTNGRLAGLYVGAADRVHQSRSGIRSEFLRRVRFAAEQTARGRAGREDLGDALGVRTKLDMALDAELDEILATDNLVSKAESRYRAPLLAIAGHLARLQGRPKADMRSNPFGPLALCSAFQAALRSADELDPPIRLLFYKAFDKQVMDRLGAVYSLCEAAAARQSHGIPAGRQARVLAGQTGSSRGAVDPAGADPSRARAAARMPPSAAIARFEQFRDLLNRQRAAAGPDGQGVVQPAELPHLVGRLGADAGSVGLVSRARLVEQLAEAQGGPGGIDRERRALSREDEDTLDLVFLFFEHLLQGNALPDPIRVLIARTQIPIAKLALLDKGFFSDAEHPARRLLNHVGQAAVGWNDEDRDPDGLYGMIERVVERLILDFDGDPGLFAQMDRYFVAYIARERARASAAERRVLESVDTRSSGLEKQVVDAAIAQSLATHGRVPPVVNSILREGLEQVLRAAYRIDGPDSGAWRAALELVDRLLWSVQPKEGAEARRELLRTIPELLRTLRGRLSVTACDQRQIGRWFRDLQTVHLSVLQEGASAGAETLASRGRQDAAPSLPPDLDLAVGSWLELSPVEGIRMRVKLAWRSPDGEVLLFVDRHGARGPQLTRHELTRRLAQGLATVLDDGHEPLADRAMRSVLSSLAS